MKEKEKTIEEILAAQGYRGEPTEDQRAVFKACTKLKKDRAVLRDELAKKEFVPQVVTAEMRKMGLKGPCTATVYNNPILLKIVQFFHSDEPEVKAATKCSSLQEALRESERQVDEMAKRDVVFMKKIEDYDSRIKILEPYKEQAEDLKSKIKSAEENRNANRSPSIKPFSFSALNENKS